MMQWKESPAGQHVELGIAEHNLFLALGAFGLSRELTGVPLLPIGTLYDPFVARGLDALYHALYAGGKFIVVATPSGVSLSPEGGAHQSRTTCPPSPSRSSGSFSRLSPRSSIASMARAST